MDNSFHPPVGHESVIPESWSENYENKLLILKPTALIESYRFEEFQYFRALAGFGCDPSKLGTKVFGHFLFDGEETSFRRYDFMGIADPEKLPEWAKEKLQQISSPKNDTQSQNSVSL